jgi:GTP 3',8-cyclase
VESARGTSVPTRWYRGVASVTRGTGSASGLPAPGTGTPILCEGLGPERAYDTAVTTPLEPDRPLDLLGRPLHDLRISVTDRCNFRCTYCMPKEVFGPDFAFLPRSEVLTFEEIERLARVFVGLGVEKLRITGGEPLVRRDLPLLIGKLAAIRRPDGGPLDLTLTTNGSALRRLAHPLHGAGLRRVTVSLDSLDDATFAAMNGVDFPVAKVLDGIAAAQEVGLAPVKVNMVVRRGLNESSVVPMARWAREAGVILRFIEYMDVGHSNGWRLDEVVPAEEIVAAIDAEMPLEGLPAQYRGEVANRWRYRDGSGEVGVIASVSQPFCGDCTRARLSAEGKLYTCLFSAVGHDLRAVVRSEASDDDLRAAIAAVWRVRDDRYSDLRTEATADLPRVEMFAMGG